MSVCCPLLRVSVSFPHHWVPGNQLTYPIVTENPIGIGLRGLLVEPETLDTRRGFPHTRAVPLFGPNITGQFGRFWRSETQVARSMVSLTTSFPTRYCPRKSLGTWSNDFPCNLSVWRGAAFPTVKHMFAKASLSRFLRSFATPFQYQKTGPGVASPPNQFTVPALRLDGAKRKGS